MYDDGHSKSPIESANYYQARLKRVVLCCYELQKIAMCMGIYLQFLHCIIIYVPIGMFCNCMKCCDYLVPIRHNIFLIWSPLGLTDT